MTSNLEKTRKQIIMTKTSFNLFFFTASFILFFEPLPTFAESLTLGAAVEEALHQSPRIQKSDSVAEEAGWKKTETLSGFLPTVSAGSTYLTNHKYVLTDINFAGKPASVPAVIPTSNLYLMAQLPLFDGFASTNKLRSASAFESAASAEADWARFKIKRDVSLQFFKALGAQALKDVAEQNLKTINDHKQDVAQLKKAGVATNLDVLRVDVQVSDAESEVLNAEDNLYLAKNKLAEILGTSSETRTLQGELPVLDAKALEAKSLEIDAGRKDLMALEEKSRAAKLMASSANRFWIPKISAFGQYQYYNNINDDALDSKHYRDAYQVGLSLNWNLFDGMASFAKSEEAIQQRIQSDKELQIARLKSNQDLEFWKRKYVYFCALYKARQGDVQKSTEALRLASIGRRAGSITNTELLDTETDLFRSRAAAVNAQLGSIEALLNLELTTGREIYKFN